MKNSIVDNHNKRVLSVLLTLCVISIIFLIAALGLNQYFKQHRSDTDKVQAAVKTIAVPDLGGGKSLATMDAGNKAIVFYEMAEIVCIERSAVSLRNESSAEVSRYIGAGYGCWGIESAPTKMQELVKKHKITSNKDCGIGPC